MNGDIVQGELPECIDCGACCFSTVPEYLRIFGDDYERMGERAGKLTRFIRNRCYMRIVDGRCAALEVDVETSRFFCSIYEDRPTICRDLQRGSPECEGERYSKAGRPLLAVESLLEGRRSA